MVACSVRWLTINWDDRLLPSLEPRPIPFLARFVNFNSILYIRLLTYTVNIKLLAQEPVPYVVFPEGFNDSYLNRILTWTTSSTHLCLNAQTSNIPERLCQTYATTPANGRNQTMGDWLNKFYTNTKVRFFRCFLPFDLGLFQRAPPARLASARIATKSWNRQVREHHIFSPSILGNFFFGTKDLRPAGIYLLASFIVASSTPRLRPRLQFSRSSSGINYPGENSVRVRHKNG